MILLDPTGRQYDQMTQAARSGMMNNVEGNERTSTSKETEMKLTNVAHASLAELKGDYEKWLLRHGLVPWSIDSEESQRIYSLRLDPPGYGKDVVRDSCAHILAQKKKFDAWLESDNHEVVANCLLILLSRTIHMLSRQLQAQGDKFAEAGGFRERRTEVRVTARAKQEGAPDCLACGKPMKQRKAARGANAGKEYWLEPERPVEFPLSLRLPSWCAAPEIRVNGSSVALAPVLGFQRILRTWKPGDQVELRLPMRAHVVTGIDRNVGRTPYASVHYGSVMLAGESVTVDVNLAGAKEITLRVLNGGNGYESDQAIGGLARFLEAGATDVIEESSK